VGGDKSAFKSPPVATVETNGSRTRMERSANPKNLFGQQSIAEGKRQNSGVQEPKIRAEQSATYKRKSGVGPFAGLAKPKHRKRQSKEPVKPGGPASGSKK